MKTSRRSWLKAGTEAPQRAAGACEGSGVCPGLDPALPTRSGRPASLDPRAPEQRLHQHSPPRQHAQNVLTNDSGGERGERVAGAPPAFAPDHREPEGRRSSARSSTAVSLGDRQNSRLLDKGDQAETYKSQARADQSVQIHDNFTATVERERFRELCDARGAQTRRV
ncbi:hypothetical protein EYF80_016663 [Liparis tanakae]|uniref:Uncharacterized protein n=1 Tax=Liparis tanakae TaxID=230148 RepID=A0A4Z2I584_9TELE|nr:hypothetical protein EYF80_016663 [Liparis tanakae]